MHRRVLHVITGLPRGGAEMMLYKLLSRIDRTRFESTVIALREEGPLAERIRELGVGVESLGMGGVLGDLASIAKLRRSLSRFSPHVVQTWLYHADLFGAVAAKLAGSPPVVWGIRMSDLDPRSIRASTRMIARICARLSRQLPAKIVCCAESGRRWHAALGYDADRMVLIPNGFDVDVFRPDEEVRRSLREELGIAGSSELVGIVARFAPQKDHESFIAAAEQVRSRFPEAHFLLVGQGLDRDNSALAAWIERARIGEQCHLLGSRDDIPRLTAACDVGVSASSFGEAFPNAIGEAMACGVPCAVTDVGDSAWIVGDTGRVVPPRDPSALATAIGALLALFPDARRELGLAARRRIVENFSIADVVRQYEDLYTELTSDVRD